MSKAHWSSDGNDIKLSMPIAKVDKERRIVSGFATLDNVDRQGDIVPSDASGHGIQPPAGPNQPGGLNFF